jgi:hypothetical protein
MHKDRVGAVEHRVEIGAGASRDPREIGEIEREPIQGALAVVAQEVGAAPSVRRLVGAHVMSARDKLTQDAAQEVGVAVVPAGGEGVGEVDEPHHAVPSAGARCSAACSRSVAAVMASAL